MSETVENGFDRLLALETAPPEHREDFAQRLSRGLLEIDRERGLVHPRPPRTRRAVILAVALLAVVVGVPALLLSGSSTAPTPSDLREIRSAIQRWEAVEFLPWPRTHYSLDRLPPGVHERMAAEKLAVAESVGTGEFVASHDVTRDQADTLERFRKSGEPLVVKSPARVVRVSYERTELDGDVIVRAVVWRGEVTARWDKQQERLTDYWRIDGTPVYEYTVRHAGDGWRLVAKRQLEISADGSGEQFGPNTPHEQQPIHSEP